MSQSLSLPQQAHAILAHHLHQGDIAIDATAGNGHDSLFLAQRIVPNGVVYSFDIQSAAINATQSRLKAAGLSASIRLIQQSHANMAEAIPLPHHGKINAVMFNLGYLPRGDKSIITETDSTLLALTAATELIATNGIITVLAYPGHAGGDSETEQVTLWCQNLPSSKFSVKTLYSSEHKDSAPRLFVLQKSQSLFNLL